MLNRSFKFLFAALFVSAAAIASHAASANNQVTPAAEAATARPDYQGVSAPALHLARPPALFCGSLSCDTTAQDCTPNGCGTCIRRSGEIFGHCKDIPQ